MFNPSRDEVRRFFCDAWRKQADAQPVTQLEAIAIDWMQRHPEYHALLADTEAALAAEFPPEAGRTNPFLHLSLHLSLVEQIQIDQPPGIRDTWQALLRSTGGDEHDAAHRAIDALAETVWEAQRDRSPPSNERYLDRLRRAAGLAGG
jgi:hypothetical protein